MVQKSKDDDVVFVLEDIPDEMRRRGWFVGRELMLRWFRESRYEMTEDEKKGKDDPRSLASSKIDEKIVTMAWAMKYQRVRDAMNKLRENWANVEGKKHLFKLLKERNSNVAQCWRFGDLSQPGKVLDKTCQINYFLIGNFYDPLDDFSAALFRCSLKIAVTGIVDYFDSNKSARIAIDEYGFYIRDTYDFNDDKFDLISQDLGRWGRGYVNRAILLLASEIPIIKKNELKKNSIHNKKLDSGPYRVTNESFRTYRAKYAKGGDFVIFSDVYREKLASPLILEYKL